MVTYYGEEIGMENACVDYGANDIGVICKDGATNSDSQYRSPMQWDDTKNAGFSISDTPWLPVATNYATLNVKAQDGKDKSHLEVYKQLMEIRRNKAVVEGGFEMKELTGNSFVFKR
jgi:alpha-glucosidase